MSCLNFTLTITYDNEDYRELFRVLRLNLALWSALQLHIEAKRREVSGVIICIFVLDTF
jgi:hypothetical protein